jgi:hypothetical protein
MPLKVGQSELNDIIAASIKEFHKQGAPVYLQGRA